MAGERPNPTRQAAQGANNPPTSGAVEAVGSRGDRQPPSSYYGREETPQPNQPNRNPPRAARPTPNQSAPTVGNTPAGSQGYRAPQQPQQLQGRVVMASRVPDYYLATGDYAKHTALMASSACLMFPVEEQEAVATPEPQQMYKPDVEAAKIIQRMSREDWEQYTKNGGS